MGVIIDTKFDEIKGWFYLVKFDGKIDPEWVKEEDLEKVFLN